MKHSVLCESVHRGPSWPCTCHLWPKNSAPVKPKYPLACCDKAEPIQCVCAYAYSCPEHGVKHIGSHE